MAHGVYVHNYEMLYQAGMQFVTGRTFCLVVKSKEWEWLVCFITGWYL